MAWILLVPIRPTPECFVCDVRSLIYFAQKQLILEASFSHNITPFYYIHARDYHKIHIHNSVFKR